MKGKKSEKIVAVLHNLCDVFENVLDGDESGDSFAEVCDQDILSFLCRLAIADDEIVPSEIRFINELLNLDLDANDIEDHGEDYDDMCAYSVPSIVKYACDFNLIEQFEDSNVAETAVNALYHMGLEFIACDDDVADKEIIYLTEMITNINKYVVDCGIQVKEFVMYDDLAKKHLIQKKDDQYVIVKKQERITKSETVDAFSSKLNNIIQELRDDKYEKFRNEVLVMVNNCRVRTLRREQGLKNVELPRTLILLGEDYDTILAVSSIFSDLMYLDGAIEDTFITEADCEASSDEIICKKLDKSKSACSLVLHSERMDDEMVSNVIQAIRNHDKQAIVLSGEADQLITLLESHRKIGKEFTQSIFLDGLDDEMVSKIFEYMCQEKDYKMTPAARMKVLQYCELNRDELEPFTMFRFFDHIVEKQTQRVARADEEMHGDKLITIEETDVTSHGF